MMIRSAIVEDDPVCRIEIADYLRKYAVEHNIKLIVSEYPDGEELISDYSCQFDIIFLDIQMPGPDGMKTAGMIRKKDEDVQIIFVTNLSQRASDGYEVDARAFLVKPVTYISFSRVLDRVISAFEKKKIKYLTLNNTRDMQRINLASVLFIESMGHYIKVYTDHGTVIGLSSMKDVEQKLADTAFYRCSNSVIVNMDRIESVEQNRVLIGDNEILISRSRKKDFMTALNRYIAGML